MILRVISALFFDVFLNMFGFIFGSFGYHFQMFVLLDGAFGSFGRHGNTNQAWRRNQIWDRFAIDFGTILDLFWTVFGDQNGIITKSRPVARREQSGRV